MTVCATGIPLAPCPSGPMTRDYRWLLIGAEHARDAHAEPNRPVVGPSALADSDNKEFRLFARGNESIRMVIRPATKTLHVFGPGRLQKLHEFVNAGELEAFLASYEQRMVDTGWALLDVDDRRIAGRS
jgi:hypothetical protein